SRSYATTPDDLWDALTNGDRIPRWFLPISGELEPGGRFQFEGNAGGTITACERSSRLVVTWEFGPHVSWVEARVSTDEDGRARLTLAHTAHLSEQWDEYGPGATGVGWEMGLLGLALHIEHPDEPRPDASTFHTTPQGRALIVASSEAWGETAIASGTDPRTARAAARSTTAFYTGEPVEEG
ncbi:MAG: polyketide cyclase, partial [Gemmatimonadetes bacterium]|nr:polyketide cyclase [Gemmatimonadota bacterium]